MEAQVGDWVRFQRNGALYIGVVEYIHQDTFGKSESDVTVWHTVAQEFVKAYEELRKSCQEK